MMRYAFFLLFTVQHLGLWAVDVDAFCRQFESSKSQEDLAQFGLSSNDFKSRCEFQVLGLNIQQKAFEACQASAHYLLNHSLEVLKNKPYECRSFSNGCLEKDTFFEDYLYCIKEQAGLDFLGDCPVDRINAKKSLLFNQTLCLRSLWKSYSNPGNSLENFCEELDESPQEIQNFYSRSAFASLQNLVQSRIQFIKSLSGLFPELLDTAFLIEKVLARSMSEKLYQKYQQLNQENLPWQLCKNPAAFQLLQRKLNDVYLDVNTLKELKKLFTTYKEILIESEKSKQIPKGKYKIWYPNLLLEPIHLGL